MSIISKKKLLIVVRWPLGGIRTYMKYVFSNFPENYEITIIASSTHENEALKHDAIKYNANLMITEKKGAKYLIYSLIRELICGRYDAILSQGFISSIIAYIANIFTSIPHICTIHGVVEDRYIVGRLSYLKSFLLSSIISKITIINAVSEDILTHLYNKFPDLEYANNKKVVIPNGIDVSKFVVMKENEYISARSNIGVNSDIFLFGFFGRFMPEKGFDLLIDAVDKLRYHGLNFQILAVGSGDLLGNYKKLIYAKGLESFFVFLPFQSEMRSLYCCVDTVVMPSRWEACPLQPMEALCMGCPLIASDCMGLREVVSDTPTMVFASENVNSLVELMHSCILNINRIIFDNFAHKAKERYDVTYSVQKLLQCIDQMSVAK